MCGCRHTLIKACEDQAYCPVTKLTQLTKQDRQTSFELTGRNRVITNRFKWKWSK